jgi:hypothetical protein
MRFKHCNQSIILGKLCLQVMAKTLLNHPNTMGIVAFPDKIFNSTIEISKFRQTKYKGLSRGRYRTLLEDPSI